MTVCEFRLVIVRPMLRLNKGSYIPQSERFEDKVYVHQLRFPETSNLDGAVEQDGYWADPLAKSKISDREVEESVARFVGGMGPVQHVSDRALAEAWRIVRGRLSDNWNFELLE